jgi:hypothetical protein
MAETVTAAPPDLSGTALDLLRRELFPNWWSFIPVSGKKTYVKEWASKPMRRVDCESAYCTNRGYQGLGVVTGEFSGGLIALDVDGPEADQRLRRALAEAFEERGQESTMSWTSGKAGRRQVLYRVPASLVPEMRHVKTIILREDGEWHLGKGGEDRTAGRAAQAGGDPASGGAGVPPEGEYQEVVLRFNQCQSVLPGSKHPDPDYRYHFLNYNGGEVAPAPEWLLEVLRGVRKPVQWLSDADQKALDEALGDTTIPSRQIRGWFFKEEVQEKLRPRFRELIFNHPKFGDYQWFERDGAKPQAVCGCPWHGGNSGTSFQYSVESGCWDCKSCGIGGDVLDFVHKTRTNNMHATRPQGPDLEVYVGELAAALGYNYPDCAKGTEQVVREAPLVKMHSKEFHEGLGRIYDTEPNPATRFDRMAMFAAETGRRLTGKDCEAALMEFRYYEEARKQTTSGDWIKKVKPMENTVANLLKRPSQVILHAAGGVGKTSACLGLAKIVGTGGTMRIRGVDVPVDQGPVLWIQSDQSLAKLKADLEDNGIDPSGEDAWFHLRTGFQLNHVREMTEWITALKPALVVIDSIGSCSSRMQVSEIEKAFAMPLYLYSELNGGLTKDAFPATTIIWIHHDNANGEVRGSRYLINAVDEQWHVRKLSDEERGEFRTRGEDVDSLRLIQIKKSRAGREGDLLLVRRDENFAFSVSDYTPTVRRTDGGTGDEDPYTLVLGLIKEAEGPLTAEEVWTALGERLYGQNRQAPSLKTVRRWLGRWENEGLLEGWKRHNPGSKGGPRVVVYSLLSAEEGTTATETPSGGPVVAPAVPVSADVAGAVLEALGEPEVAPASGEVFEPRAVTYGDEDIPEECR